MTDPDDITNLLFVRDLDAPPELTAWELLVILAILCLIALPLVS